MKGDFTRSTFRPEKHYSRVLQQQGRVQLDADWNEAVDILTYRHRLALRDIIGACCAPEDNAGYRLSVAGGELRIGAGRYYVDGILCESEAEQSYEDQPDLPGVTLPTTPGRYVAYLDVWERHITALEDPTIREVALGGPDTATRTKVLAQVKLAPVAGNAACADFGPAWSPDGVASTGTLAARAQPPDAEPDPCLVPPSAGYRRLENQLYRVEIRDPGPLGTATFLFSRENANIVSEWIDQDGDTLVIADDKKDDNLAFHNGDWVELTDDTRELHGRRGILVQLASVVGRLLTINPATISDPDDPTATSVDINDFSPTRKVRRWDSEGAQLVTVPADNDGFLKLEDGVEVRFGPAAGTFQTGDYWLIPARTNLGDVLWPRDPSTNLPLDETRHGIIHNYCSLALLDLSPNGDWAVEADCRCFFPPLTDRPDESGCCCCTVTVGDGSLSRGDFDTIKEAVDAVAAGGTVCLLPGRHELKDSVLIDRKHLTISGCGEQTLVVAPPGQPAFIARDSRVHVETVVVVADSPDGALILARCTLSRVRDCLILNHKRDQLIGDFAAGLRRREFAGGLLAAWTRDRFDMRFDGTGPAVSVYESQQIALVDNRLRGLPAVQLQAKDAETRHNAMIGGVWIWDGSRLVDVVDNHIQRGGGPGILLGGVLKNDDLLGRDVGVRFVTIRDNHVIGMGHNGIASATELDGVAGLGDLADITITGNLIAACARQPELALDGDGVGGVILSNASRLVLRGNRVLQNGGPSGSACGILLEMCDEVEISGNDVAENGTTDLDPLRCLDFRALKEDSADRPLVLDGFVFRNSQPTAGGRLYRLEENAAGAGEGTGLRAQSGLILDLPESTSSVSLLLLGQRAQVEALDESGDIVMTGEDAGSQPITLPRELVLQGKRMRQIRIQRADRLWLLAVCVGGSSGYQAGIAALFVSAGDQERPGDDVKSPRHEPGRAALMVHGNNVITPAGQAMWAVGTGPWTIADNVFTTLGEVRQPIPPADEGDDQVAFWLNAAQVGRCVSLVNLGVALELSHLAVKQPTNTHVNHVANTISSLTGLAQGELPPGHVMLHGNQIHLTLARLESRFVFPAVFVLSLDDGAIANNQIRSDIVGGIQLSDAVVIGSTARINENRLSERTGAALASIVSGGLWNSTTNNVSTHCVFALGANVVDTPNQVINGAQCERVGKQLAGALIQLASLG